MNRSLNKSNEVKPQQERDNTQQFKLASSHFRSIFSGISKRIQYLALSKMIGNVGKYNIKCQKLKLVAYLSQRCVKHKKITAFNRLRTNQTHHLLHTQAVKNFALIIKRINKNNLVYVINQLKGRRISLRISNIGENRPEGRSSFKSRIRSESSKVLSISEDSLNQSRQIVFVDNHPSSQELQQMRRMILSEEVRQGLMKMQRFERNYDAESEKHLKQVITVELRRLQKMKNEITSMRSNFYDNELTITCLFNHIKLVAQMNKELQDFNALRQKNSDLQSKLGEVNSQHRKEISQYKRKLLFFDVGASRDKSIRESMTQSRIIGQNQPRMQQFNNEEQTTFNFLVAALKNKTYKDVRREIQHFIKKSNKESLITILKQIVALIKDSQALETNLKQLQKTKAQSNNYMTQFDKFLRNDKPQQLQKLKNKCKAQATFIQLSQLFQSIININTEVKRLRKKDSDYADRQMKSAEKQRFKKNVENQNEQLRSQLKKREIRIADLQDQRQKLAESLKKSDKPKPSLPPRRPISTQKQQSIVQTQAQALRRQQNELRLKRQVVKINRQIVQLNEKHEQKIQELSLKNKQAVKTIQRLTSYIQSLKSNASNRKIAIPSREDIQYHLSVNQHEIDGGHDYQSKLSEYEARLVHTEQKLANYKLLFEKTKKERDNLRLLIEEKNEEYELCKENQQKYEQIKRLSEEKIMELKYSYESNEFEIRKIENQIERLLNQRENMLTEKQTFEVRMNQLILLKDQEIQQLKRLLDHQQAASKLLQHQIQHLQKNTELQILNMEQEKKYLAKCLQIAEEESSKNRLKYESQLLDYKGRCEKYVKELQECKQDFTMQRQILRRKVSEYSQISQAVPAALADDAEKQQLRRQLHIVNEQLANNLRSSEGEKREARKYVQKMINEAQMQSALYNEEKRILREEIEGARNQEYAINQDKIRKLREDIQALRAENERLTSIIDENEVSFNQLVAEHKDMHQGIVQLQEHNSHLQNAVILSQSEKQQLSHKLQQLEQKLADFEIKIIFAINEGQAKEEEQMKSSQSVIAKLETTIFNLNQQNTYLTAKHSQQARQLIDTQKEIIRLEAETDNPRTKGQDMTKYLEQKILIYQQEAYSFQQKQAQMMKKIQSLMRTVNQYENELQRQTSLKRDEELKLTVTKNGLQRQLTKRNDLINKLQLALRDKDSEMNSLKNQYEQRNNIGAHARVVELQASNHKLVLESYRLKTIVEQYNRSKSFVQQKMEENHKMVLQNKRLLNKLVMVQQSSKLIQQQYLKSQSDSHLLQKRLRQSLFNEAFSNRADQRTVNKSFKDELTCCQQQLKQKQDQIHQLRMRQSQLQGSLKRSEQALSQLAIKEQSFNRQKCLLEDAKRQLRNIEQQLHHERSLRRSVQEDLKAQINQKMQQTGYLQKTNQQLYEQNSNLMNKLASSPNYEHQFLLEIAKQLDQNYEVQGEQQEIELRILQKISTQISDLIQLNAKFKQKCQHYQSKALHSTGDAQISLLASIRYMFHDLTAFLSNHQFINPQRIPSIPHQTNPQKLISELGLLLKDLFSHFVKSNEDQISKYNHTIQQIRVSIDEFYLSNSLQSLNKLKGLISPS